MFMKQLAQYVAKFENVKAQSTEYLDSMSGSFDVESIRVDCMQNTKKFQELATQIAKKFTKGVLQPYAYAGAVAAFLDKLGITYQIMGGFCLPQDNPNFDKELAAYESKKPFKEHPCIATHLFLRTDCSIYEYYFGNYDSICKIDVVTL